MHILMKHQYNHLKEEKTPTNSAIITSLVHFIESPILPIYCMYLLWPKWL